MYRALILFLLVLLLVVGIKHAAAPAASPLPPAGLPAASVVEIVDGESIDVLLDGQLARVRPIGMDLSEPAAPGRPVEAYNRMASAKANELLDGQTVLLESDPGQGDRDEVGHLLRYLWLPEGRLYNLEMILAGYAREDSRDRPYRYQTAFLAAEATAREVGLGFWAPASPQ